VEEQQPTILYVDDLPMNLKLFEATFHKDYDIVLCESPHEALKILQEREIQVLVSDQRMPEMLGTELLELVAEKHPHVRRYLLTAYTDAETVIEGVNKGRIHGYIKKPMVADEVRQSINQSLEVYHLSRKNEEIMEELKKANESLLNLDGLKSEIIHSMSNEISKPLNRIMATLHLLKNKIEGEEMTEVVNILDHSVFKLEQFSMFAKQISLLKSPSFKLKTGKVSLKQIIQFGTIETSEELQEQGIRLIKDRDLSDYHVEGDSGLLVSCLVSLIHFAREHTEAEGEISVQTDLQNNHIICQVEDQGANYNEPMFEMLSNHFSEGGATLNLSMGIGLAGSQMIMEVHGGCIIFDQTPDKRGCLKMVFPKPEHNEKPDA
jgi:K+-sensing histidine kinase KdpD